MIWVFLRVRQETIRLKFIEFDFKTTVVTGDIGGGLDFVANAAVGLHHRHNTHEVLLRGVLLRVLLVIT